MFHILIAVIHALTSALILLLNPLVNTSFRSTALPLLLSSLPLSLLYLATSTSPPCSFLPTPPRIALFHSSHRLNRICPFATNLQIQVLRCSSHPTDQIRIILNDAAVPLTGINGCPEDEQGMCPLEAFVGAMQTLIGEVDFARDCAGP